MLWSRKTRVHRLRGQFSERDFAAGGRWFVLCGSGELPQTRG